MIVDRAESFDPHVPLKREFFQVTGLLWKINHDILHPQGLALAMSEFVEGHEFAGLPTLTIIPSDDGIWEYTPEIDEEKATDWAAFVDWLNGGPVPPKMADIPGLS